MLLYSRTSEGHVDAPDPRRSVQLPCDMVDDDVQNELY